MDSAALAMVIDRSQTTSGTSADYAFYPAGKQFGNSATWNNSNFAGTWTGGSPGSNLGSNVLTLGGTGTPTYEWIGWDITEFARHWSSRTWTNGMVLKSVGEGSSRVLSFFSSASGAANGWRPVVAINWTPPACDPLAGFIDGCGAVTPYDDPDGPTTDAEAAGEVESEPLPEKIASVPNYNGTWSVDVTNPQTGIKQNVDYRASGDTWWDGICDGGQSKFKVIKKYPRPRISSTQMEKAHALMYCGKEASTPGKSKFGIRHVRDEHKGDWTNAALMDPKYRSWGHFMHWAVVYIFDEPDHIWFRPSSPGRPARFCHEKFFTLKEPNGEFEKWAMVALTGKTGQRIIDCISAELSEHVLLSQQS